MIDLGKNLELNEVYKNAWNNFSKSILLSKYTKTNDFLLFVDSEKQILSYKKIFDFLGLEISEMSNFTDFVDFYFNNIWKFIVFKEFFNLDFDEKFVNKNIFQIKKWDKIETFDLTKKLNNLEIKFSEYFEKNTFSIKWEIFSYFTNSWKNLKISFWWDEIDEIFLENKKIESFTFWLNKNLSDFFLLSLP